MHDVFCEKKIKSSELKKKDFMKWNEKKKWNRVKRLTLEIWKRNSFGVDEIESKLKKKNIIEVIWVDGYELINF